MRILCLVAVAISLAACLNPGQQYVAPSSEPDCVALDQCHEVGDYNSTLAACTNPLAPDGTACTIGGNTCVSGSACQQGNCTGGTSVADGTACNDENACTTGEACQSGACVGGTAVTCTQEVPVCYASATCDPTSGCPSRAAACNSTISAPMTLSGCPLADYFGTVTIGNQDFNMVMDSGSSTLAVAGSTCTACANANITPLYIPSSSSTAQNENTSSVYGDGSTWSGRTYLDQVSVPAYGSNVSMRFASMTDQNNFFGNEFCNALDSNGIPNYVQGIMGLGNAKNVASYTESFIVDMGAQGNIIAAFSVELCDYTGQMWMGGYDPDSIDTPVSFTPTLGGGINDHYYSVTLSDIQLGGSSLGYNASTYDPAIVDTGTSYLLLPTTAYDRMVSVLSDSSAFQASFNVSDANSILSPDHPCVQTLKNQSIATLDATLPKYSMVFPKQGGGTFTVDANATESYLLPLPDGPNTCFVFTVDDVGSNTGTIIGNTVMRSSVVVFDLTDGLVGFTPQSDSYCAQANPFFRGAEALRRNTKSDHPPALIPHRGQRPRSIGR